MLTIRPLFCRVSQPLLRSWQAESKDSALRQDLSRCGLQETTAKPARTAERGRTFGDAARRARAAKALCRREERPRRSHPRAIGSAVQRVGDRRLKNARGDQLWRLHGSSVL